MSDGKPAKFDPRAYVALDHGMPENPKVIGLTDAAFRMYIEAICYCSRQQSDGAIPPAALRRLGDDESADDLAAAGLLERHGKAWAVHDYLLHQRSAEEIQLLRDHKADNGIRGAHARWHVARRKFDPKCVLCNPDAAQDQQAADSA
jgi:hypothetical protein